MQKIAAGNWKMNGISTSLSEISLLAQRHSTSDVEILICPPVTLLGNACSLPGSVAIGAQNCHISRSGAYTGEISAQMIAELGAKYVIIGHSERRSNNGETDYIVQKKMMSAQQEGLTPIVCIGETLAQRQNSQTLSVIKTQLDGSLSSGAAKSPFVIAYEPVWAIGTGHVPSMSEIAQVHEFCRKQLKRRFGDLAVNIPLLYGGSVKGSNAAEIFALQNVNGALVGGASLKAEDFSQIILALEDA
jgi:triosephosphate isomerase